MRVLAVDWSGRLSNPGSAIWLAEARSEGVVRLEGGRDREELAEHLLAEARADGELVVGLDFAFSFPRRFVERHASDAVGFWDVVAKQGERWLAACEPPFWRARGGAPPVDGAYRRTDRALRVGGIRPESVFKLVGAAQVGPGAIRGMPMLARLRREGFAIWPFDDLRPPAAVEIWPRVLTDAVVKRRRATRLAYLDAHVPELPDPLRGVAASGDDMFDAAVAAVVMWRNLDELLGLRQEPENAVEGRIWAPRSVRADPLDSPL